jgi:pimeloyl-ACP methyl ester carboxylesterase
VRRTVHTPDDRVLAVEDRGDRAGWPVFVHHGSPSSRRQGLYGSFVRDAAEHGLRLIGYDRPGYGESSPQPGRTVADSAADVRTICAELGIDRMATWGISGGAPHALACAALLPDLVAAAALLASPAPFGAGGLDYLAGMSRRNVDDIRLFLTDEAAARKKLDKDREEILAVSLDNVTGGIDSMLTPADAAATLGGLYEFMLSCTQDALAPGSQGWWDDNCMFRPWGFDLADIAVPVLLLYGRQDLSVPPAHGEWLAAHIPGVEARPLDDDGHLTIPGHVPEVHAWLSAHR